MSEMTIDQLWDLAFSGTTVMVRTLALSELSKVDPERFKKLQQLVGREHPAKPPPYFAGGNGIGDPERGTKNGVILC